MSCDGDHIDPVCGARVEASEADLAATHYGRTYYFCSKACFKAFKKNPYKYLRPRGFFGQFLDRLAKNNQKEFRPQGPACQILGAQSRRVLGTEKDARQKRECVESG